MLQSTKRTLAILTITASLGGAGWALAGGSASTPSTAPSQSAPTTATGMAIAAAATAPAAGSASTPPAQGARPGPPLQAAVTGDAAAKIRAAVLAKVPGATIDRIEQDPQGYHAHVTKSDGSRATARLNAQFEVTSVDSGGPGGPGGQRPDETPLTGDDAAKATAAALAKLPGSTVVRVETDADGGVYEAHVTKPDGSPATVIFDKAFNVTQVQER